MHTQYPKIEEDNKFPKVLSAKQLVVLPQLYLDSNLDNVCSQVA
jgi:hypothetical protein